MRSHAAEEHNECHSAKSIMSQMTYSEKIKLQKR
jgi:hypothetical protein